MYQQSKKAFALSPSILRTISLQTKTKIQQALKGVLNCCNLEIVFKCQRMLSNFFHYKEPILKDLVFGVVYKSECGLYNESYYDECIRHLDIRSGEHLDVSLLAGKKVKSNNAAICDHLVYFKFLPSYENFSALDQKVFYWKLKKTCYL